MNRPMTDYSTIDVKIIKHKALRAALKADDTVLNCGSYIDTHAGPGSSNNCPGSPMIASDQANFGKLLFYEDRPKQFAKLKKELSAIGTVRQADGFNSWHYANERTFIFMDPQFKSIKDYFKIANYLQSAPGIGALMLMYPVNTAFPIEDFHTMLQREVGGVNFLIKRKRITLTRYYCMFSSDVSVIPAWTDILSQSQLVAKFNTQHHIGDYLFKKRD